MGQDSINEAYIPGEIMAPTPPRIVKLDATDKRILYLLLNNSRLTSTRISKIIKVPKEMVMYRINKLVKEGVIIEFYAVINTEKLGYMQSMLNLNLKNVSNEGIAKIISFLREQPFVNWVMTSSGQWDLMTMVQTKDITHLDSEMNIIFNYLGEKLRDYHIFSILDFQHTTPTYITKDLKMPSIELKGKGDSSYFRELVQDKESKINIDAKDIQLLRVLSFSARKSLKEIGEIVKLSSDAVNYRIKKLIKQDIIKGFKVRLNNYLFGYQFQFLFVKIPYLSDEKKKHIYDFCKTHPLVNATFKFIGPWNFCFEIITKDAMDLKGFITELKQHFGDLIHDITPALGFNQYKFTYLPGGVCKELSS